MNKRIIEKTKRWLAVLTAVAIIVMVLPQASVFAEAETFTYSCDGYDVEYTVLNEWENGRSVEVKITNTGDEAIPGWAIKYDAGGEISNLWNASFYSNQGGSCILKNSGWNYEIAPGQTVNFGYILTDGGFELPDRFELCSKRVSMTAGYETALDIIEQWDTGFKAELVITNKSDKPIEAWTCSFDSSFKIDNLWDGRILESTDFHYTVASELWTNPIPANGSARIGFVGTKSAGKEIEISSQTLSSVVITDDFDSTVDDGNGSDDSDGGNIGIELSADTNEIPVGSGYRTVYFYASTDLAVENIELISAGDNGKIATMVDNGNYYADGDDMAGDGVFSCKVQIDISGEHDYYFFARSNNTVSENVNVYVYAELTDAEINATQEVDDVLDEWKNSPEFSQLSIGEKEEQTLGLLVDLARNGTKDMPVSLLSEDSISYDSESRIFTFSYSCGILGGIMLADFDDMYDGSGSSEIKTQALPAGTASLTLGKLSKDEPEDYGSAVILYAFDNTENSERYPHYVSFKSDWESRGLPTTIDTDVTVSDFKNSIKGNSLIIFSMHGGSYKYGSERFPTLHTLEKSTKNKDKIYSPDLKKNRIVKIDKKYCVLPKLFTDTYKNNELDDAVVFFNSCSGFGNNAGMDYSLGSALFDSGAATVVGFHNSVYSKYGRKIMNRFVLNLLKGRRAAEALNDAMSTYGKDDSAYCIPGEAAAYPVLIGEKDRKLFNADLLNGSFDKTISGRANILKYWNRSGDARILAKLGEITPMDGHCMAMISTGVGSGQSSYLGGTEGSVVSQTFKIPDWASSLSFSYNVVSEEPMEFVGSVFDDKFYARIYDVHNVQVLEAASESVNASKWYPVNGIDFDGGDSTVFHTGWKNVSVDVSACRGSFITVRFGVYDVGDSAYDTAALIDNVVFE